jgi:hypothetical protein
LQRYKIATKTREELAALMNINSLGSTTDLAIQNKSIKKNTISDNKL